MINLKDRGIERKTMRGRIMAVFVLMLKEFEDEDRVVYLYGPNENSMGKIEYDKRKKVINQLSSIDSIEFADEFFFR